MVAAVLCLAVSQARLPTFEDVLKYVHAQYVQATDYRETWTMSSSDAKPDEPPMRIVRTLNGKRSHLQLFQGDKIVVEGSKDGTKALMVMHDQQMWMEMPNVAIGGDKDALPKMDESDDDNFKLVVDDARSAIILFKPTPKVQSLTGVELEGKPMRLLQMSLEDPKHNRSASIKIWLLPKKWTITRVEVSSTNEGEKGLTTLTARIEDPASLKPSDLEIDPKSYKGYTKLGG